MVGVLARWLGERRGTGSAAAGRASSRRRRWALRPFGLHDCYARHWLPDYGALLDALAGRGSLRTLDEVADELFLASAV